MSEQRDRNISNEPRSLLDEILSLPRVWMRQAGRWPSIENGARASLSYSLRRAVFQRDGGHCLSCGTPITLAEARLDHIVPWSAGGNDRSDNLRILCDPCNSRRGNRRGYLDFWGARRSPVALCCADCAHRDHAGQALGDPFPVTEHMLAAFCANCGIVSRTWPAEVL
jgi:hypothetical protein